MSPSPSYSHQRVVVNLSTALRSCEVGDARVIPAPFDVELRTGRVVQPDLLVLPHPGAKIPILAVEVLSQSTRNYDRCEKFHVYETAGIRSYWIIDPQIPSVTVHLLGSHSVYDIVATVRGDDCCEVTEPFPITFRPADLLA